MVSPGRTHTFFTQPHKSAAVVQGELSGRAVEPQIPAERFAHLALYVCGNRLCKCPLTGDLEGISVSLVLSIHPYVGQ